MPNRIDRREFFKASLAAGAVAGFPAIIPSSALGKDGAIAPSERVKIGVISCGDRSGAAGAYHGYGKSQIVAVCDPVRDRRLQKAKMWGGCDDYNDFRDLLARKDVDAVHISTADHWHVPISLAAARAGKDVYCEKPLGISIEQDLAARQIVEEHNRVFQYGTQQRSMAQLRMGLELVLNGHIGDVQEVYVWAPQGVAGGSATPVLPVPDGFDYDLWQGPAPEAPFCKDRCLPEGFAKGIWHIYDYAIGFIAGWGAHPMDQLQWWADQLNLGIPVEYKGSGTLPTQGLFNTITHWNVECTYANGMKMHFLDNRTAQSSSTIPNLERLKTFQDCTMFVGSTGWVAVSRGGWAVSPDAIRMKARDPGPKKLGVSTQHQHNFVDSVLAREQPVATLESAVQSDIICHLSDIAIRAGDTIRWDPKQDAIVGHVGAARMMHRPMRAPWTL